MATSVPDSIISPCSSRPLDKSPNKSPAKRLSKQAAAEANGQDDVAHNKPNDQETAVRGMQQSWQQAAPAKPNKYIQLLNAAYPLGKSKVPTSSGSSASATTASTLPGRRPLSSTERVGKSSTPDKLGPTVLRSSGGASPSPGTKLTPLARVPRSRASILDSSSGSSMIPASPVSAAASPSAGHTAQPSAARPSSSPSLARRSMPASAAKPQYAFGTRIDAESVRKPSPMRQSASSTAPQRSSISPQRVPATAKSAQAPPPLRSASAPRMAAADKGQSRFAVHQANAVAEQRSKTPNPAVRAKSIMASPAAAQDRVRAAAGSLGAAAAKHVARLRSSQDQNATKGPETLIIRNPSPATRAAARSQPAATASLCRVTGASSRSSGPLLHKLDSPAGQRVRSYTKASSPGNAASAGDKALTTPPAGIPTIRDRYRDGFKHTPAAAAVAEARAAATSATAAPCTSPAGPTVPKLSLSALLSSTESPALLRTRQREESPTLTTLPSRPREQPQTDTSAQVQLCNEAEWQTRSPYLGRVSAVPDAAAVQQQSAATHTTLQLPRASTALQPAIPADACADTPCAPSRERMLPASTVTMQHAAQQGCADPVSPPLLQRKLSTPALEVESHAVLQGGFSPGGVSNSSFKQMDSQASVPSLSKENSSLSIDSAVAVAAKGLVLPSHSLQDAQNEAASPPKHRRGATSSPKGAAAVCSQLLKNKASSICTLSNAAADAVAAGASTMAVLSPPAEHTQVCMESSHNSKHGLVVTGLEDAAVPSRLLGVDRRSPATCIDSTDRPEAQPQPPAGLVTPVSAVRVSGAPGSASKPTTGSSPADRMRMLVPKLDLTPVLLQLVEDDVEQSPQGQQATAGQTLALQYYEDVTPSTDDQPQAPDQTHDTKMQPGAKGNSESTGSGIKRGSSSSARGGARGGGSNRKGSVPEQQPAPEEAFYVYEAVMPAEETRTYEELRRALLKSPGGHKLAANLQGLWGCYQDARRNTEAMAFRGHRLLDQVSNEYCAYKRHAEEQLLVLQQECDTYKGELQVALIADGQAGVSQLAAREQQMRDLQRENEHLRLQLVEMEKAMQQAAEYHFSQQADQVPVKARTIAESATTSILLQQTMAQQEEILKHKRELEDMKAALVIACGALKETNYMDPEGPVRSTLQPDTIEVLDLMIQSTAAEASMHVMMSHSEMAAAATESPCVHIEELHDTA